MSDALQVIGVVTPLVKLGDGSVLVVFNDADGQERRLKAKSPTLTAMVDFEAEFGRFEEAVHPSSPRRLEALRRFTWMIFARYQKDLTEAEVGAMFDLSDYAEGQDGEPDGAAIQLINLAMTGRVGSPSPKVAEAGDDAAPTGE